MAKLDVPPTKSQYLELRRSLTFAEDGFELLEQKRTILTIELMGHLDAVRRMEKDLDPLLNAAFAALKEAALASGSEALERQSFAVRADHDVTVGTRPLMGLPLPQLSATYADMPPRLGTMGSSARTDEVAQRFTEVLKLVGQLAELQNLIVRLARELRKTQRRVNALSKQFIPAYRETIDYISETLEERERESIVIMKMIKGRLTRKKLAAAGAEGD
jgi:V/A-type H+-transporting ATPase subunit D